MPARYRKTKIAGRTKNLHRHIVEQRVGRDLSPDEHVHHRDGDRFNNALSNLEVLPAAVHQQTHANERLVHPREKQCTICAAAFTPERTKRRRQQTCSRPCANELRSRTERATKARPPAVAAAIVSANLAADVAAEVG